MVKTSERTRTLSEHIQQMLGALRRKPIPKDGICSHHGIGEGLRIGGLLFYVELTHDTRTNGTNRLLVKCYHSEWTGGPNSHEKPIGRGLVAKIRRECRKVGPILEDWNLGASSNGGSVVIDVECPPALCEAQERYHAIKDVFNMTKADESRVKRFDAWFRAGMEG